MNVKKNFEQAALACEKKDFKTAKQLLNEIIASEPDASEPYRLLGQIASEEGNVDAAVDYLIEALKIDPKNMWALIMMGNVMGKQKGDIKTAHEYFDKVLSYYPDNGIALNNLAATLVEVGQYDEAIETFKKVINLDKTYPNSYYGLIMCYMQQKNYKGAFETALKGAKMSVDRPENKSVRTEILRAMLFASQQFIKQTNYMNVVLGVKDMIEQDSPLPIEFINDNSLKVYAKLEYAPYHHADKHVVRFNGSMENYEHLMVHEMQHLRMQLAATKAKQGKVIHQTKENEAAFNRLYGTYMHKSLKGKADSGKIAEIMRSIQEGICLQLMNCPLDLFVEHSIYDQYPVMRPIQLQLLYLQEQQNIRGAKEGEVLKAFPPAIVHANKVMNICTSLHFKELYGIDLVHEYKPTAAELAQAKDLLDEFHAYWDDKNLKPGEEYELVEYFLNSFNMDDLVTISSENEFEAATSTQTSGPAKEDYDIYTDEEKERQRQFEEDSAKPDAARDMMMTMYILAALEEFAKMTKVQVRKIATEIAMLGMNGIDPNKKSGYRIPSIDRDFGGNLLLAYYYTSWKLAIPEMADKMGLPYIEQYRAAQKLYAKRNGGKELSFG